MLKRSQIGFTLIETTLVLAISSLLVGLAFTGQSQLRVHTRFTDSVEKAKNGLARIQSEAISTYQNNGGGNNALGNTFFAKRVRFTDGSDTFQVDTLLFNKASNAIVSSGTYDPDNIRLPWGVHYTSAGSTSDEVLFVRWPTTGTLYVFTPAPGFADTNFASYDPLVSNPNRALKTYQLEDSLTPVNKAKITINGATGTINRVFP